MNGLRNEKVRVVQPDGSEKEITLTVVAEFAPDTTALAQPKMQELPDDE